ncbi:DUF554 domain-containing protein [Evansella cellulosilytica]|uniref:DUF554 domain-containing protein n=1 Tax=Evansella cellulosilytica (strain ATCC 21833 / DSM 2522 / FERM P-1141 / JCM 9156 / N-4) TaxID=649639 RepID=E6TZY1_EVAC2|nr:DUF554 domain-containing protein [Evansella cellulosilytica]ADU32547.1 protein of unknown function DUF554 [Evansella cellulosilytica DSM 2522]
MVLFGTIVNGIAIIVGTLIGINFKKLSKGLQETVMKAIGLAVIILGVSMTLEGEQFLITILSLAFGAVLGEAWNIEGKLNRVGEIIEKKMKKKKDDKIAEGFVAATLLYVVGAMAIIGALDSGLRHDHSVLLTKSVLDGFSAIVFAATMGIGVIFSAIPVVIYQGTIALTATFIDAWVPEAILNSFIQEVTAVGGIMILGIGLNLLGVPKIRVANLLPAIPVAIVGVFITTLL